MKELVHEDYFPYFPILDHSDYFPLKPESADRLWFEQRIQNVLLPFEQVLYRRGLLSVALAVRLDCELYLDGLAVSEDF